MRRFVRKIYEYWMAFGQAIGRVMTPFWLLVVYLLAIGPTHLVTVLLRKDPLDRSLAFEKSFWRQREPLAHTLEEARHQF